MEEKKAARQAEKRAIEDARYVLPNACETKIVLTMNITHQSAPLLQHAPLMRAQWKFAIWPSPC